MNERAERLQQALSVLGVDFFEDPDRTPAPHELELANALVGVAEAYVIGTEIDVMDDEIATQAEAVADQVLEESLPEQLSPLLVFQFKADRLERSLTRAVGMESDPDDPVLAAARDAAVLAAVLISYRLATERLDEELPESFLELAVAALGSCAQRLRGLTE
ncbi:hypothetical protein [Streptomyces noursei]|uniref:Uncharacterized protein n=1 Tax=Streptomyces noursei TaxID=1971 RepID=A0A2N8PR91_STRNR|nr:hypothetical protein [Streptomyces noursei]PNE43523.1 hypothetical protein AOB60_01080 [Streptomyces noursei]